MRFILILFTLLFSSLSFSAPTTGGFAADAVLAIKPQLITDTSGIRYWDVPVVRSGVTGVATVAEDYAVGRVLAASRLGTIGMAGAVAVEAVKAVAGMCMWQTDKWHDCTQRPTMPINIDTSQITAATASTNPNYFVNGTGTTRVYVSSLNDGAKYRCSTIYGVNYYWVGGTTIMCSPYSDHSGAFLGGYVYQDGSNTTYSCSSGTLTNSTGAPMAVTGQYCTPSTAYSCPANYFRSDSSGNSDSGGIFCSYSSPVYDDTQAAKLLAPYLLDYYGNQLFTGKDGKPLDVFSAPNTTFDPAASPSTMPMTLDQLKQYVDWVRNGTAQTTDPLAPHYISPNNYDYTKNYINTNNTTNVTNNTSSASSTITPEQTASSAAMTQTQYEQSNAKADSAATAAINATDISSETDYRTKSGYDVNQKQIDTTLGGIAALVAPVADPVLHLPSSSTCRQIPISFAVFGHQYNTLLPTDDWCAQLQRAKTGIGYFLYLLTAIGIIYELVRRVEE